MKIAFAVFITVVTLVGLASTARADEIWACRYKGHGSERGLSVRYAIRGDSLVLDQT